MRVEFEDGRQKEIKPRHVSKAVFNHAVAKATKTKSMGGKIVTETDNSKVIELLVEHVTGLSWEEFSCLKQEHADKIYEEYVEPCFRSPDESGKGLEKAEERVQPEDLGGEHGA